MMPELSLHILDIANNSVRAKAAKVNIEITENKLDNIFEIIIIDNGTGIPENILATIKNPFTTTRTMRKVGLGIPFFNQLCELCNGSLVISSTLGVGTKVVARMEHNNIDRPPLGDIASTIVTLMTANEDIDIEYRHIVDNNEFSVSSKELKEILGEDISLSYPDIYTWILDYIKENVKELYELESN